MKKNIELYIDNCIYSPCISIKKDILSESNWYYQTVLSSRTQEMRHMGGSWDAFPLSNPLRIKEIIQKGLFPKQIFIDGEGILNET